MNVIVQKPTELLKAKYISKKRGKDGKWVYNYGPKDSVSSMSNKASAKALHKESTSGLPSESIAADDQKEAEAVLSIHSAGGNYERYIANKDKVLNGTPEELQGMYKQYKSIRANLPDVERKAYNALFMLAAVQRDFP